MFPASAERVPEPGALVEHAASHATRRVPIAHPNDDAGTTRADLVGTRFESAHDVAVVEGPALVGTVSIERLLAAQPGPSGSPSALPVCYQKALPSTGSCLPLVRHLR